MFHDCLLSFFDKNSLWGQIRIRKTGFNVKTKNVTSYGGMFQSSIAANIIKLKIGLRAAMMR
jgi:hypothetical protein